MYAFHFPTDVSSPGGCDSECCERGGWCGDAAFDTCDGRWDYSVRCNPSYRTCCLPNEPTVPTEPPTTTLPNTGPSTTKPPFNPEGMLTRKQTLLSMDNYIIQICSGITLGRVLNGELYAQGLQKLIYLHLSTDCVMKISVHSLGDE